MSKRRTSGHKTERGRTVGYAPELPCSSSRVLNTYQFLQTQIKDLILPALC